MNEEDYELEEWDRCQYRGLWSQAGCNEEVEGVGEFCYVHRHQGPSNRFVRVGCSLMVVGFILIVLVMFIASQRG